jgi:glycerate 2-kinase
VARAAGRRGIPVVVVAGRSTLTEHELDVAGISAVYPLSDLEPDLARSSAQASQLLRRVGQAVARSWPRGGQADGEPTGRMVRRTDA